jgi:hypothetical protein
MTHRLLEASSDVWIVLCHILQQIAQAHLRDPDQLEEDLLMTG